MSNRPHRAAVTRMAQGKGLLSPQTIGPQHGANAVARAPDLSSRFDIAWSGAHETATTKARQTQPVDPVLDARSWEERIRACKREILLEVLIDCDWHQGSAAKRLRMSERVLSYQMQVLAVSPPEALRHWACRRPKTKASRRATGK